MDGYRALLTDPRWQKRRLEIFSRDGWACQGCGSGLADGRSLHVHHERYTADLPWDEPDENLTTLCERCHDGVHLDGEAPWDLEQIAARVALLRQNHMAASQAVRDVIALAEELNRRLT